MNEMPAYRRCPARSEKTVLHRWQASSMSERDTSRQSLYG
jgi:hypothetical protein